MLDEQLIRYFENDEYEVIRLLDYTEEQKVIRSNKLNLKEQVNAAYVPKELVELPDEIIQVVKVIKELNY